MSVVRREALRRWAVVAAGVTALGLTPAALDALPTASSATVTVDQLVRRVEGSGAVAHQGLAEMRGTLGLPDLPALGNVAALLGGSTRARVWWLSPQRWRVDTITLTGERDTYRIGGTLVSWDYEADVRRITLGDPAARLPRTDDLLAPQAARRALALRGPADRITRISPRRVAGRTAFGLRLTPGEPDSTVGSVEMWADPATGLPLEVQVRARGGREPALVSRYLDVTFGAPSQRTLDPTPHRGVHQETTTTPDLASIVDFYAPWQLPRTLAGRPQSPSPRGWGGTATYGRGLARFAVLPLPAGLADRALHVTQRSGGQLVDLRGGQLALVPTPLLSAAIAVGNDVSRGYLLAGTVTLPVLQAAVTELFANPPMFR